MMETSKPQLDQVTTYLHVRVPILNRPFVNDDVLVWRYNAFVFNDALSVELGCSHSRVERRCVFGVYFSVVEHGTASCEFCFALCVGLFLLSVRLLLFFCVCACRCVGGTRSWLGGGGKSGLGKVGYGIRNPVRYCTVLQNRYGCFL